MAQGTGTPEDIIKEAASIDVELPIPEKPEVDLYEDPLPELLPGGGLPGALGFVDRFKEAANVASPTYNLITGLQDEYSPEVDPEYSPADHTELFQDLPDDLWDYMLESTSASDAQYRLQQIKEEQMQMQRLMQDGSISGMGYALAAGTVTDPIFWAGMAAEGAGAINAVSKFSRLSRISSMGVVAGTTAAVETGILAHERATVDAEDVLYAGATGLALGTAGGHLVNKLTKAKPDSLTVHADALQHNTAIDTAMQLDTNLATKPLPKVTVDQGESIFGRFDPEEAARLAAEKGIDDVEDVLGEAGYSQAYTQNVAERLQDGSFKPQNIVESKTFKYLEKNPLMSDFVRLYKSKSDAVKFFASEMLENASGVGGQVRKTASVLAHTTSRKFLDATMPALNKSYRDFAKANKIRIVSPEYWSKARKQWNSALRTELEHVRNASVRGTEYVSSAPSYIQSAVKSWRTGMREMAEHAKASGVKGFDDFQIHEGYVPLVWKGKRIIQAAAAGTLGRYQKLLATGYELAGITSKDAKVIAKAVFNRQTKKAVGIDTNPGVLLSKDSRHFLREMLENDGMSEGKIEALFGRIDIERAEAGKSARAKGRTPVDLTVTDGELSLLDLVDNDLPTLGSRYFTEMSGRSAMARKGITNDGAWRAVKNTILKDAVDSGDANIEQLTKILDGLYNQFLGQPVGDGIHKGMRRLMDQAMLSMLGMVGVPQLAESGNIIAAHGLSSLFKYAPDIKAFKNAVKNGTADNTLLGELKAHLGGMWDEHLYYRPEVRLDDAAGGSDGMFHVLDNVQAAAKNVLGYASGMNHIKNIQQQFTAISQANKVVSMLKEGTENSRLLKRFGALGWDETKLQKFKGYIDDGTITFQDNGAIDRLNLGMWDAVDVEDFSIGMQRHSAQLIQFPLIGESSYWQHSTFGAMMTQLRSFSMLAIEKQTARNLRFSDPEAFSAFTYSLGLSAILYTAKTHAVSIGKQDRQEYLDKRLNAAALVNGAIQWSGVFSVTAEGINAFSALGLLPADWGSGSVGRGGVTSFSIDKQVPAVSTALSGLKLGGGLLTALSPFNDHEFGKQEVNNFFASIPLGNTYPAVALKNILQGAVDEDD